MTHPVNKHVLIVEARFYEDIADEMKAGAIETLEAAGCTVEVVSVPGALEIPAAVSIAIAAEKFGGFVALGTVIRGETAHFEYVAHHSIDGLQKIAREENVAIGTGILTTEIRDQAWERAARTQGNKGKSVAKACLAVMAIREKYLK